MRVMDWRTLIEEFSAGQQPGFVLSARPALADWLDLLSVALQRVRFAARVQAGQVVGMSLATVALLVLRLAQAGQLLQRLAATIQRPQAPPTLPAAAAGLNLAPRLLPVPRAALAG